MDQLIHHQLQAMDQAMDQKDHQAMAMNQQGRQAMMAMNQHVLAHYRYYYNAAPHPQNIYFLNKLNSTKVLSLACICKCKGQLTV